MNAIDVFGQWQLAEQAAAAAEAAMAAEATRASECNGQQPPSDDRMWEAVRLRATANALFELKMALVGDLIDSSVYGCAIH